MLNSIIFKNCLNFSTFILIIIKINSDLENANFNFVKTLKNKD